MAMLRTLSCPFEASSQRKKKCACSPFRISLSTIPYFEHGGMAYTKKRLTVNNVKLAYQHLIEWHEDEVASNLFHFLFRLFSCFFCAYMPKQY
jgi:hypothetical protein